ncbi:putative membrane protein [Cucumis melo var. makuwa]|uniref:Putative membrane protein n=1 Tax=Cucumis melo var. makuwa TaxID=1194695 RepID=A0A5D3BP50_CUCMM|nr:putative membrane protein [Cucumis melo var. makuwa]
MFFLHVSLFQEFGHSWQPSVDATDATSLFGHYFHCSPSSTALFHAISSVIVAPISAAIIVICNSSVIVGLFPAHFFWTFFCFARTKKLGIVFKTVVLVFLPLPLILWPAVGIVGSLVGGIGYGFFVPLIATFEAVGAGVTDKLYHCLADGCLSTIKASCLVVMDFTDFCFNSYFSYMDELGELMLSDEKPMEVKLSRLPYCLLASLIGLPVDFIFITLVALWRSPYMLFKGWKRLLEDLVGREGPFLEAVCVPFAGLAIILWPLAVVGAVISAIISSFFLGLYAGVIVHQEDSFQLGLAYILSVVSMFDEYVNDLLYLREGSCIPRPKYRRNMSSDLKMKHRSDDKNDARSMGNGANNHNLVSEQSRTLKWVIQHYKPVLVWDWLFMSCEVNGRLLLQDGLITTEDIEECILKGNSKKLSIRLPAWCILQCLLSSAKSNSPGLVISNGVELTRTNLPRDTMFEWFLGPLLLMKEQIKRLHLEENEEICLRILIMRCRNEIPEDWDNFGFPSLDRVRRAQLQAIFRRLQGIVNSVSRIPSFRRRFRSLIKVLYVEALQKGSSADATRIRNGSEPLGNRRDGRNGEEETANTVQKAPNSTDVV